MTYDPQENYTEGKQSIFGVIIHSFFIIPFLIAVFSVLLFAAVRIMTMEKQTVYDFLSDVKTGGLPKRWQSAFELSKILSDSKSVPNDPKFDAEMIAAFKQSEHDDNRVRQYLALAMGRTGKEVFIEPLRNALKDAKEDNLYSIIYSLGLLKAKGAINQIADYIDYPDARIRLVSVMALGNINDPKSVDFLKKCLNDSEPNVQWDSAISLAKLKDPSGRDILLNLLNRNYLSKFPEVDIQEQTHILLTAIEASSQLNDPKIKNVIKELSVSDQNMNVRKLSMQALNKAI